MKLFVLWFFTVFGMAWAQSDTLSNVDLNLQISANSGSSSQSQQVPPNSGSYPQPQQYPSNSLVPLPQQFTPFTPYIPPTPKKNYFINRKDRSTWLEAKERCQLYGMQLATVDTREKYNHLRMQLDAFNTDDLFWVYGTRTGRGAFYWPATNQELSFTDWAPNEPNNVDGNEEFLSLMKVGGEYRFNDLSNGWKIGFVCEYM